MTKKNISSSALISKNNDLIKKLLSSCNGRECYRFAQRYRTEHGIGSFGSVRSHFSEIAYMLLPVSAEIEKRGALLRAIKLANDAFFLDITENALYVNGDGEIASDRKLVTAIFDDENHVCYVFVCIRNVILLLDAISYSDDDDLPAIDADVDGQRFFRGAITPVFPEE